MGGWVHLGAHLGCLWNECSPLEDSTAIANCLFLPSFPSAFFFFRSFHFVLPLVIPSLEDKISCSRSLRCPRFWNKFLEKANWKSLSFLPYLNWRINDPIFKRTIHMLCCRGVLGASWDHLFISCTRPCQKKGVWAHGGGQPRDTDFRS